MQRTSRTPIWERKTPGGIAAIDSTVEFKEIIQRTPNVPVNQITFLRDNVYRYYGVNEKVLTSTLSDQEWISFYENVIEPIAIQLSYEFTFKLFDTKGNRVREQDRVYGQPFAVCHITDT